LGKVFNGMREKRLNRGEAKMILGRKREGKGGKGGKINIGGETRRRKGKN